MELVAQSGTTAWAEKTKDNIEFKTMAAASKTVWAGNLAEEATLKEPMELGPQNGTPALAEKTKDNTEFSTFQTAEEAPSLPPWRRCRPLPPFWSEEWCEKYQFWYYWISQTQLAQWERPRPLGLVSTVVT